MKHLAKAKEFDWGAPEPFALVSQQTLDGERIAREREQKQQDKQHAEKQQVELV